MKKVLILFILLSITSIAFAQLDTKPNRHFIIAIDGKLPNLYKDILKRPSTLNFIDRVLSNYNISNDDYISIVSYQVDLNHPDFNNFAWIPVDKNGQKISWRHLSANDGKRSLAQFGNWPNIVDVQHARKFNIGIGASFQTISKEYILCAAKSNGESSANETYILMLTDDRINGGNDRWDKEWATVASSSPSIRPFRENVSSTINKIDKLFRFTEERRNVISNRFPDTYKLIVYKVNAAPLPIQSITNIPAQLPFKRVRGGYAFDLDLHKTTDGYSVKKIELNLEKSPDPIIVNGDVWNKTIEKPKLSEGDTATVRFWVKYVDGFYNGFTFNPYETEYARYNSITQSLELKDDAKIFGKLPVPDILWWFWPNKVQNIVIFWDLIFILIFIAIICTFAYKLFLRATKYTPSNNDIHLYPMTKRSSLNDGERDFKKTSRLRKVKGQRK